MLHISIGDKGRVDKLEVKGNVPEILTDLTTVIREIYVVINKKSEEDAEFFKEQLQMVNLLATSSPADCIKIMIDSIKGGE